MRDPRSPVLRASLGLVSLLYRTPLRVLLGRLYLVVSHRGRKTGRVYETLVTILHRDDKTEEVFVTSSMRGSAADWYLNLKVAPPVRIQIGGARFEVEHRFLDETERCHLYRVVCDQKPVRSRFGLFVTGNRWPREQADFETLARDMPAIAFRIRTPVSGARRDEASRE
jgi:deazaflavin-dependent oxidoreductase (nitroreductase family)